MMKVTCLNRHLLLRFRLLLDGFILDRGALTVIRTVFISLFAFCSPLMMTASGNAADFNDDAVNQDDEPEVVQPFRRPRSEKKLNSVIVCQHGNRHRYAIAECLYRENMLKALYTDSCRTSLLGKMATVAAETSKKCRRLAHREIALPPAYIHSTDLPLIGALQGKTDFRWAHRLLSWRMKQWGADPGEVIFSMYDESVDFLKYAKTKDCPIIVDVFIAPDYQYLVDSAYCQYYGLPLPLYSAAKYSNPELDSSIRLADILSCPSAFVADSVRRLYPEAADKIRICPYGSSIDYTQLPSQAVPGRFFWAGGDWFRKGGVFLTEAAKILKPKYPQMEFRIAGVEKREIERNFGDCGMFVMLGKLDRQAMLQEFLTADAFVFPTLAEGMSGVLVEALSAGCPVIATGAGGVDGLSKGGGILLPDVSVNTLVDAIESFYLDRVRRQELSLQAKELSQEYSIEAWQQRLKQLVYELGPVVKG